MPPRRVLAAPAGQPQPHRGEGRRRYAGAPGGCGRPRRRVAGELRGSAPRGSPRLELHDREILRGGPRRRRGDEPRVGRHGADRVPRADAYGAFDLDRRFGMRPPDLVLARAGRCFSERRGEAEPKSRLAGARELGRRAVGDDPALAEDRDPVRQPLDVGEVVASSAGSSAPSPRSSAMSSRVSPPRLRVHARPSARRGRAPRVGRRARGPARVAAARRRTGAGTASAATAQPHLVEEVVGVARRPRGTRRTAGAISRGRRPRVEAAALEHQPDPRTKRGAAAPRVLAEDPDRARRRPRGSPRRSRRSSSCRRRSARAAPRPRRARPRGRDAVDDGPAGVRASRARRPRSPARRRLRPSRPPRSRAYWRSNSASVSCPDLDRADDAIAVDEVDLRPGRRPGTPSGCACRVDHRRPRRAVLGDERLAPARRRRPSARRRSRGRRPVLLAASA